MTESLSKGPHWHALEELFHAALELDPPERSSYLERVCQGDPSLRAEVERLLSADRGPADGFLRPPTPGTLGRIAAQASGEPGEGARIGAFTLMRRIASGGMGTVYEAVRSGADFEQRVAVKLIRGDLLTERTLERFRNERRTLARLNHPNIARLLEGGTSADGRPYLVMEFVEGLPIDEYCDQNRLGIRRRLELFRRVCSAVHYAHRNLVVHRDLKPSNILVDADGTPRLLDFGIAKVFTPDEEGEEDTGRARTVTGEQLMTPDYASPEQIQGLAITTASDVFSLGVVLYELLIGSLPHRRKTSLPHELARAVLEERAEQPSTVIRRLGAARESEEARHILANRGVDAARLGRILAGDLDTIVLMALRKEPERRYASVAELAEDLERHERGLPVRARPDTWSYRTAKFVRRHRLGVGATAAVVLAIGIGGASVAWTTYDRGRRMAEVLRLMRLADLSSLEAYEAEVDRLWPATPERAPAMEAWLAKAHELAANLAQHTATLAELRARARPMDEAARAASRPRHPRARELADLYVRRDARLFWLEQEDADRERWEAELEQVDREIGALEAEIDGEVALGFSSEEERWQHAKLAELVERLERFVGSQSGKLAEVEGRLAFARSVARLTLDEPREAWRTASASIADAEECPAYGGLRVYPQLGLVPIGRDPDSGLWEFAHLQTGALAARGADGRLIRGEQTGLVFVLLPGGPFRMGARLPEQPEEEGEPNIDPLAAASEGPVHEVTLAPFFLSKFEMTQGQWQRFTGANPSHFKPGETHGLAPNDGSHPLEMVSWEECDQVLGRLGLELPSEAQWEYAARAGTSSTWWTGWESGSLEGAANLADLAAKRADMRWPTLSGDLPFDDGYAAHAPVGSYRANAFGIHDVHGNVWEWTADDFANYELPVRGPRAERLLKGSTTVVGRGGSFMDAPLGLRVAHRGSSTRNMKDRNIGVRPARSLQ